ncbi:hypothetical protein [Caudoviricetes sp.]|nr:hypothetical protein [Caudoviricetes sp.]
MRKSFFIFLFRLEYTVLATSSRDATPIAPTATLKTVRLGRVVFSLPLTYAQCCCIMYTLLK